MSKSRKDAITDAIAVLGQIHTSEAAFESVRIDTGEAILRLITLLFNELGVPKDEQAK